MSRTPALLALACLTLLGACSARKTPGSDLSDVLPPPQLVAPPAPPATRAPTASTATVVPSAVASPVTSSTSATPTPLPAPTTTAAVPKPPAEDPPVTAESFAPLPVGSRLRYVHHSAGSLGTGEGRMQVTVGRTTWQGRPALALTRSASATDVQDPTNRRLLAVLDGAGHPAAIYQPPLGIQLPLSVGKTWVAKTQVVRPGSGRSLPMSLQYTVHSVERLTVPAGTFTAWRVHAAEPNGDMLRVWLRTGDGLELRRSYRRAPSHAMGAGAREVELEAIELPAKAAAGASRPAAARR